MRKIHFLAAIIENASRTMNYGPRKLKTRKATPIDTFSGWEGSLACARGMVFRSSVGCDLVGVTRVSAPRSREHRRDFFRRGVLERESFRFCLFFYFISRNHWFWLAAVASSFVVFFRKNCREKPRAHSLALSGARALL